MAIGRRVPPLFPLMSRQQMLEFQCSSWYPKFAGVAIQSTIIRPLGDDFKDYMNADGVYIPQGSEDHIVVSSLSDDEDEDHNDDNNCGGGSAEAATSYSFPHLDARIREVIKEYGAVFPKLNFTAPKDAAWAVSESTPMKCTSPADVYALLKSSDFICHDLDENHVFEGCDSDDRTTLYELELVLKKWFALEPSREFRCFVRDNKLIAISQRGPNYYEFLNDENVCCRIKAVVRQFCEEDIQSIWNLRDCIIDVLLHRNLQNCRLVDLNPFAAKTDPLLFSYEEIRDIQLQGANFWPTLRIIGSRSHPQANRNAPEYYHNRVPIDALDISAGRDTETFSTEWINALLQSRQ